MNTVGGERGRTGVQGKEKGGQGNQSNNCLSDTLYHPYSHSYIFIKICWLIPLSHYEYM